MLRAITKQIRGLSTFIEHKHLICNVSTEDANHYVYLTEATDKRKDSSAILLQLERQARIKTLMPLSQETALHCQSK